MNNSRFAELINLFGNLSEGTIVTSNANFLTTSPGSLHKSGDCFMVIRRIEAPQIPGKVKYLVKKMGCSCQYCEERTSFYLEALYCHEIREIHPSSPGFVNIRPKYRL